MMPVYFSELACLLFLHGKRRRRCAELCWESRGGHGALCHGAERDTCTRRHADLHSHNRSGLRHTQVGILRGLRSHQGQCLIKHVGLGQLLNSLPGSMSSETEITCTRAIIPKEEEVRGESTEETNASTLVRVTSHVTISPKIHCEQTQM